MIINNIVVSGKISDEHELKNIISLLQKNVQASNDENIELYLSTLSYEARDETKIELMEIFKKFDLTILIKSVEVIKQNDQLIKLRVIQQTENHNNEKYRNHQATVGITFTLIEDEWLIAETMMENTEFNYIKE